MKVLRWVWQLPQHILALAIIAILRGAWYSSKGSAMVYAVKPSFGVSLGDYIILGGPHLNAKTIDHEYGHSRQSIMLGPLYLIVVGLPSVTMNLLSRIKPRGKFARAYYQRWPENWADKLGGVHRA